MFCPRCAQQNSDDAKFCRACSENLKVVAQAMTRNLPVVLGSRLDEYLGRRNERLRRDSIIYFLFGFLCLLIDIRDWFLLLLASSMFGTGIWYMLAYRRSLALESGSGKPTSAPGLKTMYCPRCGESNGVDIKFCPKCSENLQAVAQAMRQRLPAFITKKLDRSIERENKGIHSSSVGWAIIGIFMLFVGIYLSFFAGYGRAAVVFILLAGLGFGVSAWDMLVYRRSLSSVSASADLPPATDTREPLSHSPSQIAPPSVTESTTRRLDQTNERLRPKE